MTRAQANAFMTALESLKIGADARMRFDAAGNEIWAVELDTTQTYTGAQMAQLAAYCSGNQLNLTLIISEMGVT
jgi:hypothetical protein